ncbi:MAG TPA: hypothetical protein VE871_13585 [Longimicrobium sp.]|nr:hypothetical protein [Longimicrobium sp.]
MSDEGTPPIEPSAAAPAGQGAPLASWECFHRSIRDSLDVWPQVLPISADEDSGDPTVRAMHRARRHAWLHARHGLHRSMFESIRISMRLAEAFSAWTRSGAPNLDVLADGLRRVENEARRLGPVRDELRFVDHLMRVATTTDLHLAEMELAMAAFRETDAHDRLVG